MKECELRLYAKCSLCHKPIGESGLPVFSRVTIERIGIKMEPVRRQDGFAAFMGSTALARVMGADEDMTLSLGGPVTLSICERCYVKPVMPACMAECKSVEEKT